MIIYCVQFAVYGLFCKNTVFKLIFNDFIYPTNYTGIQLISSIHFRRTKLNIYNFYNLDKLRSM